MTTSTADHTRSSQLRSRRWHVMIPVLSLLIGGGWWPAVPRVVAAELGTTVSNADRVTFDAIDHSAWHDLLQTYVDSQGLVDYRGWSSSTVDVGRLDAYLDHLSSADPNARASRAAKLAYWINAYNAVTVKGILQEYPTKSIRDHTPIFGYNIWKHLLLQVGDSRYSLNDIEHNVLREMNEPRIHFAIVCASISCPRLLDEAYSPNSLDDQLARNAKHFFAQEQNFHVDTTKNTVYLSSIMDWFKEDFGDTQAERIRAIASYLPSDEARRAATSPRVDVKYTEYDWGLNEQKDTNRNP